MGKRARRFLEGTLPMVEGQPWSWKLNEMYMDLKWVKDIDDPLLQDLKNSGNDLVEKRLQDRIKELTKG